MIRMNPAHDTKNPPGCHYEKPLADQINDYKRAVIYYEGFKAGYEEGRKTLPKLPEALTNSEYAR